MKNDTEAQAQVVPSSVWTHRNGNVYTVLHVANHASDRPEYPLIVVYQGANGNVWARLLSDWHRSMTPQAPPERPTRDATDEDVRVALRDLGAECQTIERWMLDGKEVAKGFVDDSSWWDVRGPNRDDPTDRTEGTATDALAAVLRLRHALEMRPPEPQ